MSPSAGCRRFKTVGDMEAQLLGKTSAVSSTAPVATPTVRAAESTDSQVACGIDIESISSLPKTTDYWDHAFYQAHFTKEEIAYCLLQGDPAVHLAGRWCVKEALKKCDPVFIAAAMNEIEVRTDAAGAPSVWDLSRGSSVKLPYAVSLSHSADYAVGTVVRVNMVVPSPVASPPVAVAAPPQRASGRAGKMLGAVAVLISLAALAVSIVSMLRTH